MAVPSKAEQDAEAATRLANGVDQGERLAAAGQSDGLPQDPGRVAAPPPAPRPPDPAPQPPAGPEPQGIFHDKRSSIVSRFRQERNEAPEGSDEITDFTRSGGMPQDFRQASGMQEAPLDHDGEPAPLAAAEPEPEPEGEPAAEPEAHAAAPAAQTVKLTINGREIEMPLEQVIAKAQIAVAADNILDVAKDRLRQVDDLANQVRDKVARSDQPAGVNQPGPQNPAHITGPQPPSPVDPNQVDLIDEAVEALQFGDPEKARATLRNTIERTAAAIVDATVDQKLLAARIRDEGARTAKVLKDFRENHSELANDPMAEAAIERKLLDMQAEDLRALGLDPSKLRPDGQPTIPSDVANAHQYYRAHGYGVRSPDVLLKDATNSFLEWKGVKPAPAADPSQTLPRAPARVDVTVDRTARRTAVQPQPARTTPPRTPAPQAPQPQDRSAIVANMKAARMLPKTPARGAPVN